MSRRRSWGSARPIVERLEDRQLLDAGPVLPTLPPLVTFGSLAAFNNYFLNQAFDRYQPYFGIHSLFPAGTDFVAPNPGISNFLPPLPPNNTGPGVNAGDIVQGDGKNLYVLANGQMLVLATQPAGGLTILSRTQMPANPLLEFLNGTRLTVVSRPNHGAIPPEEWIPIGTMPAFPSSPGFQPQVEVSTYDVSNPAAPVQVQDAIFDGVLASADAIGGKLYVTTSRLLGYLPRPGVASSDSTGFTYETQAAYASTVTPTIPDLLLPHFYPSTTMASTLSGVVSQPADIYQPRSASDNVLDSILAFDTEASGTGLLDVKSYIAGSAPTVYATMDHLYLVTSNSVVQRFDIQGDHLTDGPGGSVPGAIASSFDLDESGTDLRIAVTASYGADATNAIYVLRPEGDHFNIVGSIEGIAPGDRISAVRYVQNTAYITTRSDGSFTDQLRSTNPLYVIDLSNASAPALVGQVEVPGIIQFLKPLDAGHVAAIGFAGLQKPYVQLALVDVTNPAKPSVFGEEVIQSVISGGVTGTLSAESELQSAFYDADQQILTLPISASSWTGDPENAASALFVYHVDFMSGLHLQGIVLHDSLVRRGFLEGDLLYSIADRSVEVHTLSQLAGDGQEVPLIDDPRDVQTTNVVQIEPNQVFIGALLSYTITDPTRIEANIQWGDDTTSTTTPNPSDNNRYSVLGNHAYAAAGNYRIVVTLQRNGQDMSSFYLAAQVGGLDQPSQNYLNRLYLTLLNRNIEAQASNYWAAGLAQGMTREFIASSVLNSSEYRTDQVGQFYQQFLHRQGEAAGIDAWVAFVANGHSLTDVRSAMLGSTEYFSLHAATAAGFVRAIFQEILHRAVDPGGAIVWEQAVNVGISRQAIVSTIQNSPEETNQAVSTSFARFLRRTPDPSGASYFAQALQRGLRFEAIESAILGSQEFLQG